MPDFRIVSQRAGNLSTDASSIQVNTNLERLSSTAEVVAPIPLVENVGDYSDDIIRVYLGDDLIFTGQVDAEDGVVDADSGHSFRVSMRSMSRNVEDAFVGNPLTPKEEFKSVALTTILRRTLDLEFSPDEAVPDDSVPLPQFSADDQGGSTTVGSWQWYETDSIGSEFLRLCSEYRCLMTDDAQGAIRIYNVHDLRSGDAQVFDLRQKRFSWVLDYTQRYSRYVGFATERDEKGSPKGEGLRFNLADGQVRTTRRFARIYRDALNQDQLRRSVNFDANRRRTNGLKVSITLPGLVPITKGTPATIVNQVDTQIRFPESGWTVEEITWTKSNNGASTTKAVLILTEQFTDNYDSSVYNDVVSSGDL